MTKLRGTALEFIRTDTYKVAAYEIGPSARLRMHNFFNYLQQTAWLHAEHLGFGFEDMSREGLAWVLCQVEAEIERFPVWGEEVELSTWPSGVYHFLYGRDFEMKAKSGEVLARIISSWMLIDLKTRRPRHSQTLVDMHHTFPKKRSIDRLPERIKPKGGDIEIKMFRTAWADLDPNRHVNTSRYIEWAINAIENPAMYEEEKSAIVINFLHEVLEDQDISIFVKKEKDTNILRGYRASDDQNVFAVKFFKY